MGFFEILNVLEKALYFPIDSEAMATQSVPQKFLS